MEIKLESLAVHNFKGISDFEIEPNGSNVEIMGANATGKTSVFDAFMWLLFGKNSRGATKFNAKPLDANGNEIKGAEPLVEATLNVDGKAIVFRREQKEVWVQPRGQKERQRKSDKTVLMIDSVPKKLVEYKTYIENMFDETKFALLTNADAFNSLDWKQRRSILLSLVSDVSDKEIIDGNPKFRSLSFILDNQTIADRKKAIAYQRSELRKKIDAIPSRIDEAKRSKPELTTTSLDALKEMRSGYEKQLADLGNQIKALQSSNADVERSQQIQSLRLELSQKQTEFQDAINKELSAKREAYNKAYKVAMDATSALTYQQSRFDEYSKKAEEAKYKRDALLEEYHATEKQAFDEGTTVCPTCHRPLPEEEIESLRKEFNTNKAKKLADIKTMGKKAAGSIKELAANLAQGKDSLLEAEKAKKQAWDKALELNELVKVAESNAQKFQDTDEYKQLTAKIEKLNAGSGQSDVAEKIKPLQAKIEEVRLAKADVESSIADYGAVDRADKRIAELEAEEDELKTEVQKLDKEDFTIQDFMREKATTLENKLNSLFNLVQFKLTERQKNGDLIDICETTVNGIPYSTDLNTGARLNAGIEIINVLSKHYDMTAPIFIDNAEAVNEIIKGEAQQIQLTVTNDKKLKVAIAHD